MAIKAGQIIHTGDTVLVQRLQTAGPGNLNIPTQKIYELGNYKSVATTRDTPDLTFTMESYDVSTAPEALLTKGTASPYNMGAPKAIDVASQWKAGEGTATPFQVVESVAIPQLMLESASYRFGIRDAAAQTFTFRGDSIFYNPGATVVEKFDGTGSSGQVLALTEPAGLYNGDTVAGPRRALAVSVDGVRYLHGVDYTETLVSGTTWGVVTITLLKAAPAGTGNVQVTYFTNSTVEYLQAVHSLPSVKPAAIRGKDITLLVNGVTLTDRWTGVQNINVDERFTIERDEEMGNAVATDISYSDTPVVNGSFTVRFRDPADFHSRLAAAMGIPTLTEAIGPTRGQPNEIHVVLHHPDTGAVLKTLSVPDAVFLVPGYSGRVNSKMDLQINFESDSGTLTVLDEAPS